MSTKRSHDETPHERVFHPPSHDDIAKLAHALWEARGGGDGGAEEDWLEAERQLLQQNQPISKGHTA
jgi:hypothetical protein